MSVDAAVSTVPLPAVPPIDPDGVTIGGAAAILGLTIETIRYYEREGITLQPTARTADGWRRYAESDLAWLSGVVMLRGTGMSMRELREFAAAYRDGKTDQQRLDLLETHRTRVVTELAETRRHLHALDAKIAAYHHALAEEERSTADTADGVSSAISRAKR